MEGYLRAASAGQPRWRSAIRDGAADRGDLPRAEDRVAAGARRRRAVRHARRHLGRCTRSRPTATTSSSVELHRRTRCGVLFGSTDDRASRSRSRSTASAWRCSTIDPRMSEDDDRPVAQDAADSRHGRRASRHRGVHPALRRPGQRPDRADRSHAGRHADRHRASASPRCRTSQDLSDRRPARRHRHLRHARAAARVFTCRPTSTRRRAAPCADRHRPRAWRRRRSARPVSDARLRRPDEVLRRAAARTATSRTASPRRSRRSSRARSSCSASRAAPATAARRAAVSRSAISSWPRGCRSSSGARRPTPSCSKAGRAGHA